MHRSDAIIAVDVQNMFTTLSEVCTQLFSHTYAGLMCCTTHAVGRGLGMRTMCELLKDSIVFMFCMTVNYAKTC